MKEYGGYLEWENYDGKEYHDGYRVDSVRSAVIYAIRKRGYTHVWLPYYICDCFRVLFEKLHIPFSYYHIDSSFLPILPESLPKSHCILLVNYYGQLKEKDIRRISAKYAVFQDNTQAFFEKPIAGIDMANSCRKFFGVTGGGYFFTSLPMDEYDAYARDTSYDKALCLIGRYEKTASEFYPYFAKNEEIIRGAACKRMSRFMQNILKSLDYEKIRRQRAANYDCLERVMGGANRLRLNHRAGLFMYPLLIAEGNRIKKELIKQKIYIPTLWPGVEDFPELNDFERDLVENLVLLPIDQRYNEKDMEYIAHVVLGLIQQGE